VRLAASLLVAAALAAACTTTADTSPPPPTTVSNDSTPSTQPESSRGATIRLAMLEPEALSAHQVISTHAVELAQIIHTGLTRRGPDGQAIPGLAESWSSDNAITWTFNLRADLTFSDGTPITAETFAVSWQRLAEQDTRARAAYLGAEAGISNWDRAVAGVEGAIIGIQILDELSFQVQLDRSFPWLPELVAHPAFAPVSPAELASPTSTGPVGAGDFRIEGAYEPGVGVTLVRTNPTGEAGEIGRFDVSFVADEAALVSAVESGTADVAVVGDAVVPAAVSGAVVASNEVLYLGFPTSRGPLSEPEPRRQMSLTIDRDAIAATLDDRQTPSVQFAPSHSVNGLAVRCQWCRFDPEEASAYAEANELKPPEDPISLHIVGGSLAEPWAQRIAADWQTQTGWTVNIVRHDNLQRLVGFLQSGVPDGPFILPWTGDYPGAEAWIEPLFDRPGADDFIRYGNDTLIEHFRIISSTRAGGSSRVQAMNDLGNTLNGALAFLPLSVLNRTVVESGSVVVGVEGGVTRVDLTKLTAAP